MESFRPGSYKHLVRWAEEGLGKHRVFAHSPLDRSPSDCCLSVPNSKVRKSFTLVHLCWVSEGSAPPLVTRDLVTHSAPNLLCPLTLIFKAQCNGILSYQSTSQGWVSQVPERLTHIQSSPLLHSCQLVWGKGVSLSAVILTDHRSIP